MICAYEPVGPLARTPYILSPRVTPIHSLSLSLSPPLQRFFQFPKTKRDMHFSGFTQCSIHISAFALIICTTLERLDSL